MTEPLTEQRPMPGPVVYGYLRLLRSAPARRHALRDALAEYCRQHELQLAGVFTDRGGGAAFAGLLDVLSVSNCLCRTRTGWCCQRWLIWGRARSLLSVRGGSPAWGPAFCSSGAGAWSSGGDPCPLIVRRGWPRSALSTRGEHERQRAPWLCRTGRGW
ncbi:hypothetical protein [Nonomuraea recticatena]|uniref:hypothetical protein n=1 Tax=Nonomuraea recticatena TaxID=46178 RepID=UPI003615BA4C